tara:strand:- start:95 stop:400 length:306 start_codon:yes stop_codon:yes gene_type:complete
MNYEKFKSFLYKPKKPFHKMTLRELCDYNKIIKELNRMPLSKIKRIESWSKEKREKKIKKFLKKNKQNKTKAKKNLKKSTKKRFTKKLKLNKRYFTLHLIE